MKSKFTEKTMIREIENRRSIRKYRSDEIDRKLIEEIILILSILVDTFISKISFPMQPGPEIGSISDA